MFAETMFMTMFDVMRTAVGDSTDRDTFLYDENGVFYTDENGKRITTP